MKAYGDYESTECIYRGKDWKNTVWGKHNAQVRVSEMSTEEASMLAEACEKLARTAKTLEGVRIYAEFALALKSAIAEAEAKAVKADAEAEAKAEANRKAEAEAEKNASESLTEAQAE